LIARTRLVTFAVTSIASFARRRAECLDLVGQGDLLGRDRDDAQRPGPRPLARRSPHRHRAAAARRLRARQP
jgi:hypothetical protein